MHYKKICGYEYYLCKYGQKAERCFFGSPIQWKCWLSRWQRAGFTIEVICVHYIRSGVAHPLTKELARM